VLSLGIVLYRVDERLIHGQVVIGWGSQLDPHRYLVVDDALAASDWEQELYHLSLPEGVTGTFVTTAQAIDALPRWQKETVKSVLLTRDVRTMLALAEAGLLSDSAVNIGGIHHAPGRKQVRHYLYLDADDRKRLGRLGELGVSVGARDLPGAVGVSLEGLLKE
jgi:PTS system mannose-specific IIB component/fructoselysine and glucoselysine-specific PTS system IIB component